MSRTKTQKDSFTNRASVQINSYMHLTYKIMCNLQIHIKRNSTAWIVRLLLSADGPGHRTITKK